MKNENKGVYNEKDSHQRGKFVKIILLIIYLVFVIILFYILTIIGIELIIILLLLGFMSLIILGMFFRPKKKKTIYSELYPDKERNKIQRPPRKIELKIETDSELLQQKKLRNIDLNFKYRKSLINKCENCGMIITGYKKNCPTCGKVFELKEVIKKCKTCGLTIPKSVKKCPICGTRSL
ncbi:MAG: hypothetical protein KGD70_02820 [Candidatus Lokiarchaeota archaeon]|jgi:RNA polymerase subunit RPABC4/transcription elongation factor Spt4|nr:hypothetical protein [Candidatus Lokiarchaeota archaeon]